MSRFWYTVDTSALGAEHLMEGVEPFFVDHISADLMRVLHKLNLADKFIVTEKTEKMWDVDELREVQDVVGYNLWYTE